MADAYTTPPNSRVPATTSVLDKQVSINGRISSAGAIRIEGRVTGDVSARTVTLAPGAIVEGGVTADVAVIEGHLTGPLHAREVRLMSAGRMQGEVVHSVLIVEAGAHFDGQCRREAAAKKDAPAAAPRTEPSSSS